MPLEVYDGTIEFAHGRHLLQHTVKPVLARIEGVASGDEETKVLLAKEQGLSLDDKDLSGWQRALLKPIASALLNLKGDGSKAALLLGERLELPVEDRSLVILASLTAEYAIRESEQWPTAALLRTAADRGVTVDQIEQRIKKGVSGLFGVLSKLPVAEAKEDKEETDRHVDGLVREVKNLWGDSPDSLRAKASAFKQNVVTAIQADLSDRRRHRVPEIRMDLADMKRLTAAPLRDAIEGAERLLETIVASQPELSLQKLPPLSALGTYLLIESVRAGLPSDHLPEEKEALLNNVISEAANLQAMDGEALSADDPGMRAQVKKRTTILRSARRVIRSPQDLVDAAAARQQEVKALKKQKGDELPYYDPRPEAVTRVLSFYLNHAPELLTMDAKLGETFAAAYVIVTESLQYFEKAREQAQWMLKGLNNPESSPSLVDAEVGRDEVALGLLGVARPTATETRVRVSEPARATLAVTVDRIPGFWNLNSLARKRLGEIFSGDKVQKGETLEKEYQVLSALIHANLHPEKL